MFDLSEAEGFTVLQARTAEDGITLAKREKSDLIIMDIDIPVVDRLTAVRLLPQNGETRIFPIVVLTSCAMKDDKEKIIEAGYKGHIAKPIDTRRFAKEVAAVPGGSS